jgi:HYR domain-containing protein
MLRQKKRVGFAPLAFVMVVLSIAAAVGAVASTAGGEVAVGTLALRAEVVIHYPAISCPGGTPRSFECFARRGSAVVSGLGAVEESYAYVLENAPPGCTAPLGTDSVRLWPTTARLRVAGKGEIVVATGGTGCLARPFGGALIVSEPFVVTGGSGVYAGASGSGTVKTASYGPQTASGVDTWSGTLLLPGFRFDLTAPILSGVVDKRVSITRRAKGARVTFNVTARDDVDGVVPATCSPRSGSRFAVGRTRVACSATDASGNESSAAFTVTVKRRR